ncbi:MAG: DedA family protein [Candidatus Daviesbacteria bacterium]|nr:DedA family protein [Candidatus Daviesbacteria bacterium]
MDLPLQLVNIVLHLDKYLDIVVQTYGFLTYAFLFLIIFCETGLVIAPFLPGDSMIFAVGALSAIGSLNVFVAWIIFLSAAILGDTVNYWIGHYIGPRAYELNHRLLSKKHLERAHGFYEKHGGKVIILARFIPIIRTFAPFVAGVSKMNYSKFFLYNIIGALLWTSIFIFAGYYFGNIPAVKKNFSYVIISIIFVSIIPILVDILNNLRNRGKKVV